MERFLPNRVVGAMAGFVLGFPVSISLRIFRIDASGWPGIAIAVLFAVAGGVIGGLLTSPHPRRRAAAQWCVLGMVVVGGVSFLAGFVGPILFQPDSPQGPLLGIFYTGPLGALAGAVVGLGIGAAVRRPVWAR
jgi:hypothetical protein